MLELFKINNKEEHDKVMEYLNDWGKQAYDSEYSRCLKIAKEYNDDVATIFNDWWNGECVSTAEYEEQYSEEDNYNAISIILETISRGFG